MLTVIVSMWSSMPMSSSFTVICSTSGLCVCVGWGGWFKPLSTASNLYSSLPLGLDCRKLKGYLCPAEHEQRNQKGMHLMNSHWLLSLGRGGWSWPGYAVGTWNRSHSWGNNCPCHMSGQLGCCNWPMRSPGLHCPSQPPVDGWWVVCDWIMPWFSSG